MSRKQNIPYGSGVSAGIFECVDCGKRIEMHSQSYLPPCPYFDRYHDRKAWRVVSRTEVGADDIRSHHADSRVEQRAES